MADGVDNGRTKIVTSCAAVTTESVDQARFAEFFAVGAERFGDAVGIEDQGVAGTELAFGDGAFPILEDAQDGGGGGKAFEGIVGAEDQRRKVAAVDVAEAARRVVVLGEEESGEGGVGGIVAKELIDGA